MLNNDYQEISCGVCRGLYFSEVEFRQHAPACYGITLEQYDNRTTVDNTLVGLLALDAESNNELFNEPGASNAKTKTPKATRLHSRTT